MTKILLADDDEDLRFLNEMALSEAGYDVITVKNGKEATEIAQNGRFDLILLDAMMPEMDGFAAFRFLKANPATSAIPVVFLTASAPDTKIKQDLGTPDVNFIMKPCDPDTLAEKIETILSREKQSQKNT